MQRGRSSWACRGGGLPAGLQSCSRHGQNTTRADHGRAEQDGEGQKRKGIEQSRAEQSALRTMSSTPVASWMARMVLPPGPISIPIFSTGMGSLRMRGAYLDSPARGGGSHLRAGRAGRGSGRCVCVGGCTRRAPDVKSREVLSWPFGAGKGTSAPCPSCLFPQEKGWAGLG